MNEKPSQKRYKDLDDATFIEVSLRQEFHKKARKDTNAQEFQPLHDALRKHNADFISARTFTTEMAYASDIGDQHSPMMEKFARFALSRIGDKNEFGIAVSKDNAAELIEDLTSNPAYGDFFYSYTVSVP